uniref:TfoX/Sxy family protein n=1 Tax=Ensifer adhaerens TaxID=106592 RepID=UPI003F491E56
MSKLSEQTRKLAEFYIDQLSDWAPIKTRPLFGAMALYRDDHVFAMVWHGALYFKVDDETRRDYEKAGSQPLGYVSDGEDHVLKSYWEVPAEVIEEHQKLIEWAECAFQAALRSARI